MTEGTQQAQTSLERHAVFPSPENPASTKKSEAYKHEVDFTLDLDLLAPEEQETVLRLKAATEQRRAAKATEAEAILDLKAEDLVTALTAAGNDKGRQLDIVRQFVVSTGRLINPEEVQELESITKRTLKRIRGLGFVATVKATKRLMAVRDDQISTLRGRLSIEKESHLEETDQLNGDIGELKADGIAYVSAVETAFDHLMAEHMGDTYEMQLIEGARQRVRDAQPSAFKVEPIRTRSSVISTDELKTMASHVTSETVSPPRGVGSQALAHALSLGRPSSEY